MTTDLSTIEKEAGKQEAESKEIEELIGTIDIQDHKSLKDAVGWTAQIKRQYKETEAQRKKIAKPMKEAFDNLNGLFKKASVPLTRAETVLKNKIVEYTGYCYKERAELLSGVAELPTAAGKQKVIKEAAKLIPPKIAGMSVTEFWGGDVTDPAAVKKWAMENNHPELLLINEKVLLEFTKAKNGDPEIPGWVAAQKIRIAITESKVK